MSVRNVNHFLERVASGVDEQTFVAELVDYVLVQVDASAGSLGAGDAEVTAKIDPGMIRRQAESSRDTTVHSLPRGEEPITVGRVPTSGVQILHSSVSKLHAQLTWQGEELMVEDLGSTNGTWVNRVKLEPNDPHRVRPDDTLRFGQGDAYLVMTPKAFFNYLHMLRRFGI